MDIKPLGASAPLIPTQVAMHEQDPSVTAVPIETVTLGMSHGPKPASKDYKCTDAVEPNADGNYVFDPAKEPLKFGPVNILANLQTGLDTFLSYCDQDKIPKKWFTLGPSQLSIYAYDRKDEPNAFFNPLPIPDNGGIIMPGVHFGEFKDPSTGETIYAAASGEVVRHEGGAGHATLHRFRPNYMFSNSPDAAAFHESFGDVTALLECLHNPAFAEAVANETGGDFTKHNLISDCGEQFGKAINNYIVAQGGPPNYTGGNWVRTAINDYKWQDPATLPDKPDPANPDGMTSEAHDLSRLWTGAVYRMLGEMVKQNMAAGMDAKAAILDADDGMLKVYGKLISNTAPEGDFVFADMSRAMLAASTAVGGKWDGVIKDVLMDRLLLPPDTGIMALPEMPKGSYPAQFRFTGDEASLQSSRLGALGNFTYETVRSGSPKKGLVDDAHNEVKADIATNLARLERQGQILFTNPDQNPDTVSRFDPVTHKPYSHIVTWDNGQAKLERIPIFG